MGRKKVIIDLDTGVDDAEALMIALRHKASVEILAITCVHGNTNVDQVCLNTLTVLKVCGEEQVRSATIETTVRICLLNYYINQD